MGLVILKDDVHVDKLFDEEVPNSVFRTYGLQRTLTQPNTTTSIVILKKGVFFTIGTSNDEDSISFDSDYHIFKASSSLLGVNSKGKEWNQAKVDADLALAQQLADQKEDLCVNIMVTSKTKKLTRIFPIIKKKDGKTITELKIDHGHSKELGFHEGNHKSFASFSTLSKTFNEMQGCFTKVTSDGITVYDQECKEKLRIKGLPLESCRYINDSYMYALQN